MSLTVEQISAVIDAKRRFHRELERALTWPGLVRICEREGVQLRVRKAGMARPAQLVPFLGEWTIIISGNTPFRRHTYLATHELGHLWLHHDRTAERWERVYNMDANWEADPREDDAEIFASLVLAGPTRARSYVPAPMPPADLIRRAETRVQFELRLLRRNKPLRRRS